MNLFTYYDEAGRRVNPTRRDTVTDFTVVIAVVVALSLAAWAVGWLLVSPWRWAPAVLALVALCVWLALPVFGGDR
jgi:Flp pilus assembly protein TadB